MIFTNVKYFLIPLLLHLNRVGRRMMILVSFLMAAVGAIGALALSDKAEDDKCKYLFNGLVSWFGQCGS